MIRPALRIGVVACLLVTSPAWPASIDPADRSVAATLGSMQQDDARLQSLGWRLATANARYCSDVRPAIGLLLQDAMNYGTPDAARAAIGIDETRAVGDIAVQAVAKGSPADLAGLASNQQIAAIDGTRMADLPGARTGDYARLAAVHRLIDTALARNGKVTIAIAGREEPATIAGVPACASTFAMQTDGRSAQADGQRVLIGQSFASSRRPADVLDDPELAVAIAHELAHVILRHGARLDRGGNDPARTLAAEREADRLAVWLLANAGFDPAAGPRLMRGWGRRYDPAFHASGTHDAWEARAVLMEAEIAKLRQVMRATGAADWSRAFAVK